MSLFKTIRFNLMWAYTPVFALVMGMPVISHADAESSAQQLEEVVVTSQKRSQNLQDVSVAVTSIDGAKLQEQNVQSVNDLVGKVPGLSLRDAGTVSQFSLRGSIMRVFDTTQEAPISVYSDDIYEALPVGQVGQVFDIDRVEVLRGPQGTLFGRNSTGGLVNFISREPTAALNGYGSAQFGSYGQHIFEAALGGPLGDAWQARVSAKRNQDDGWQQNVSQPGSPDWNAKDTTAGRLQLKGQLTSDVKVLLSYTRDHERNRFQGYSIFGAVDPATGNTCSYDRIIAGQCRAADPAQPVDNFDPKHIRSALNPAPANNLDTNDGFARVQWQISPTTMLTSITGYKDLHFIYNEDFGPVYGYTHEDLKSEQFTQELRLNADLGWLNYVAGLYYFHLNNRHFLAYPIDPVAYTNTYPSDAHSGTDSYAVFGQATYKLTDTVSMVAGLRYTRDRKSIQASATDFSDLFSEPVISNSRFSKSVPTGKLGLEWHYSPTMLYYTSVSTGYKSGEFGQDPNASPGTLTLVKPEKATSVEVGEKAEFLDRTVRLNMAAFYTLTKDKQANAIIQQPGGAHSATVLYNIGNVNTSGVEAELLGRLSSRFELGFNGAFVHARVSADPTAGLSQPYYVSGQLTRVFFPFEGTRLAGTPQYSYNTYARYTQPTGIAGEFALQSEWQWQSKVFWRDSNDPHEVQNAYGILNLRAFWTPPGHDEMSAELFVDNVLDKSYTTVASMISDGTLIAQWGTGRTPRWFGARFAYTF